MSSWNLEEINVRRPFVLGSREWHQMLTDLADLASSSLWEWQSHLPNVPTTSIVFEGPEPQAISIRRQLHLSNLPTSSIVHISEIYCVRDRRSRTSVHLNSKTLQQWSRAYQDSAIRNGTETIALKLQSGFIVRSRWTGWWQRCIIDNLGKYSNITTSNMALDTIMIKSNHKKTSLPRCSTIKKVNKS